MNILRKHIGEEIEKIYLRVWSPYGEKDLLDTDIGLVIKFKNIENLICFTSKGDSLKVVYVDLPSSVYCFTEFQSRMEDWWNMKLENIDYEFYDFTESQFFKHFIGKIFENVSRVFLGEFFIGFKFDFDDDYIYILEYGDGTTIETKIFNRNDALKIISYLGDLRLEKL